MSKSVILFLFLLIPGGFLAAQVQNSYSKKVAEPLKNYLLNQPRGTDSIDVMIAAKNVKAFEKLRILYQYEPAQAIIARVPVAVLSQLILDDQLVFIDLLRKPREEITTGAYDLSANEINFMQKQYPGLGGAGITASVKELSFDSADIDIRGRHYHSGLGDAATSSHASIMATMIAGGGNSTIFAKGVAPASRISSSSYNTLLPDHDSIYFKQKISVQNHSYGTGIENYYGADAAAYDKSVHVNPTLLHVFSAGNIGTTASAAGPYAGVQGYANLSGSFKMSKNSLSVGAIDSFYNVMPGSSRGPAYDGRVKPELVAFGEDGSSGAAALVSGTAIVMQQAYKQNHNDSLPHAALVKAVLINTADDIGNSQVDYASGYGKLNAWKAVKSVAENSFIESNVTSSQTRFFPLTIPLNTAKLKVTVAWTDTSAIVNAAKALVNDLDLVIRNNGSGQVWLPWVLSRTSHPDSLSKPAYRSTDTVNNIEQVSIDLPPAGNYTIEVRGSKLAPGIHPFFVAFDIDTINSFRWTYPSAHDPQLTNDRTVFRWKTNLTGNGILQVNDGNSWQTVSSNADLSKGYFPWSTPGNETILQVRILAGNREFMSDSFVISKKLNIKVGFNCADSLLLFWNRTGADQYRVYQLGEKYMEAFHTTADSFLVFSKAQYPSLHFAVAPVMGSHQGLRSSTINYQTQSVDCYFTNFLVLLQGNFGLLSTQLGSLHEVDQLVFLKQKGGAFVPIHTQVPASTLVSFTDSVLTQGINIYKVMLVLNNGQIVFSDAVSLYYFPNDKLLVFPNPAAQGETVKVIGADYDVYSIMVYDSDGRLVHQLRMRSNYSEIPASILSKGIYFVKVNEEGKTIFTRKLVIY